MSEPSQPSLRRLKQFGVRPVRDLGQNFLIDSNLLEVIGREADLGAEDVVLEVGGGLGVLSEFLAARARHVHVVEIDTNLEPALRDALDPFDNVTLHFADAVRLDLPSLDPAPVKVIANLPYGVAATVVLETLHALPTVTRWVAMVQREVGERLAAAPGTPAYGAPSVLAQLSADVKVARAVSRTVFHPVPNVDSVLVRLERTAPPAPADVRRLVSAGFAHRRKALPRSLSLAGAADRDAARAALEALGLPADVRAERLGPEQWVALAEQLEVKAYAKLNLSLYVGHPREDGYHPLVSVFQSVTLADALSFEPAERDEVVCAGVSGTNLAERALAASRAAGWDGPPVRITIDKRIPVAAGLGGGSADAAAVLRFTGVSEVAASLGADVPFQLRTGRALVTGIGEQLEGLPPGPPAAFVILPSRHELSTPKVYAEADRLGLTRDLAGVDPALLGVNDLQDAARSLCPEIDERLALLGTGAMVAGSGPTVFRGYDDPAEAAAVAQSIPEAILTEPV